MQVLVVDDQGSVRALVRTALRSIGVNHVVEAEDGQAGLLALAKDKFGLVITDLNMPRLDGLGMLRAMREDPRTANIPVVVLTGSAVGATVVEAAKLGAVGVIAKPFSLADFTKRLTAIRAKIGGMEPGPLDASAA